MLNSEKKDRFKIPEIQGFGDRKMSKNSNRLEINSNRGAPARSIMSTRSKGPSVNDILAKRKESI